MVWTRKCCQDKWSIQGHLPLYFNSLLYRLYDCKDNVLHLWLFIEPLVFMVFKQEPSLTLQKQWPLSQIKLHVKHAFILNFRSFTAFMLLLDMLTLNALVKMPVKTGSKVGCESNRLYVPSKFKTLNLPPWLVESRQEQRRKGEHTFDERVQCQRIQYIWEHTHSTKFILNAKKRMTIMLVKRRL